MFDLVLGSGAKAQSCDGRLTIEKVLATRIGYEIGRNTRCFGFFFGTKEGVKILGTETDFGAGVSRKLTMICFLEVRLGVNKCTEVGMASLRRNLASVHAKV